MFSAVVVKTRKVVHRDVESITIPACGTIRNFGLSSRVILKLPLGNKILFVRSSIEFFIVEHAAYSP